MHLPAERDVVVDAKVPMDAYLRALETTDEAEQQELLRQHGRQTRQHIDALASKSYHAQFASSPEFVVMFIPNEGVYCAALEAEPTLLEHGAAKGVLIATPTTLIALLHATYYGWRQEKIAESAREIAAAGRELHKRIATFLEPYAKLGRQLELGRERLQPGRRVARRPRAAAAAASGGGRGRVGERRSRSSA